jgi:hypothetical protein
MLYRLFTAYYPCDSASVATPLDNGKSLRSVCFHTNLAAMNVPMRLSLFTSMHCYEETSFWKTAVDGLGRGGGVSCEQCELAPASPCFRICKYVFPERVHVTPNTDEM